MQLRLERHEDSQRRAAKFESAQDCREHNQSHIKSEGITMRSLSVEPGPMLHSGFELVDREFDLVPHKYWMKQRRFDCTWHTSYLGRYCTVGTLHICKNTYINYPQ
jgi:hypothetical protein